MWRTLLCLSLVVAFAGFALAEDKKAAAYQKAQIARVNADTSTITLRVGTGTEAKEMELKVSNDTKIFGADKQPVNEGLKFKGLKDGADVWFQMGTGATKDTIVDLRLYDPALPGGDK